MKLTITQIFQIIVPCILVFVVSIIFPVGSDAGKIIYFRPPAWVFGIAWFILLLLFGFSWAYTNNLIQYKVGANICYSLVVVFLIVWIIMKNKRTREKYLIWVLFITLMLCLFCYTLVKKTSKLLLVPLITWILFAIWMSVAEIIRIYPTKSPPAMYYS